MNRRNFVQLCMAGIGSGAIVSGSAMARSENVSEAGGVYYTKEAPGRWKNKVAGHLPTIEINKANGKVIVRVVTAHEMNGFEHYIVKHVLLDQDYNFINEKMFNPIQENSPVSKFTLNGYTGKLYALSMCNKHDVWLNEILV